MLLVDANYHLHAHTRSCCLHIRMSLCVFVYVYFRWYHIGECAQQELARRDGFDDQWSSECALIAVCLSFDCLSDASRLPFLSVRFTFILILILILLIIIICYPFISFVCTLIHGCLLSPLCDQRACHFIFFDGELMPRDGRFQRQSFLFLDELLAEKEKYKGVSEELDMTLNELSGY